MGTAWPAGLLELRELPELFAYLGGYRDEAEDEGESASCGVIGRPGLYALVGRFDATIVQSSGPSWYILPLCDPESLRRPSLRFERSLSCLSPASFSGATRLGLSGESKRALFNEMNLSLATLSGLRVEEG